MLNRHSATSVVVLAICTVLTGCGKTSSRRAPDVAVKAGIFFGGQLQQRAKWPLVIDPALQTQGFRVQFRAPLTQATRVAWEISRPRVNPKRRVVVSTSNFEATIPAGTSQNDQLITLDESDRPGKWKLRVLVNDAQVFNDVVEVVPFASTPDDD